MTRSKVAFALAHPLSSSSTAGSVRKRRDGVHAPVSAVYSVKTKRIINHLRTEFAKSGTFQQKIIYIKLCDALIRDHGVAYRFKNVFLSSL